MAEDTDHDAAAVVVTCFVVKNKDNYIKGIWYITTNCSYYLSYTGLRCGKSILAVRSGDRFSVDIKFSARVRTSPEAYPGFSTRDTGSYSCYLTQYTLHTKLNFTTSDLFF